MVQRKTVKHAFVILLAMALSVFALAGISGCSNNSSSNSGNSGSSDSSSSSETKTVTDAYGREVTVPVEVDSVATVGSGARFVVYAGGQDKLVAVTEMETNPSITRPYTVVYNDLFTSLPTTSNGNHLMETSVNTEELVKIAPDVIISSRSASECDELQNKTGIPVVGISYQNQLFTDNVYNSILCVGEAIGTEEHAESTVAALKDWAADLDARTADIPDDEKPTVYVGAVNYKGAKSFGGTYCGYAPLEAVHGNNVADSLGQTGSVDVSLEQIGTWDPDYMFLNASNMDLMQEDYNNNKEFFDGLKAFQTGNVYTQPSYNFNGTNVEIGVCDAYFIGATIYPDRFSDVDLQAKYSEILTTMLGEDFYPTMQEAGLDFTTLSFS